MEIAPYLNFNGNCREAFEVYARVLGGKIVSLQTFAETPAGAHVPAEWRDKVIHVRLVAGSQVLMGADAPPPHFKTPQGLSVTVTVDTPEQAERIFKAIAEDGVIMMPFQKTFWSPGFGGATDRFGISWMINAAQPAAVA